MISQTWKNSIAALIPNVTVLSNNEADFIKQTMAATIYLARSRYVNWSNYQEPIKLAELKNIIPTLEKLLQRPIDFINNNVYVLFFFKSFDKVIKTDINYLMKNYSAVHYKSIDVQIWDPMEGYIIEVNRCGDIMVGLVDKCSDPIPELIFKKKTDAYTFMRNKGAFYEFIKTYGLEIFSDDEANTILAEFQSMIPFTSWGHIDWDKFEKRICVGKNANDVLPALEKMFTNPFDTGVYVERKQLEAPLMRINLTPETTHYRSIWSRACGTFLFNLEERYVIEVDLQGNIMVGLIPEQVG